MEFYPVNSTIWMKPSSSNTLSYVETCSITDDALTSVVASFLLTPEKTRQGHEGRKYCRR